MSRLNAGDTIEPMALETIHGRKVDIPSPGQWVHLQLRRFAGCPVCNLHLRSIARRHGELSAAGLREVAVFLKLPVGSA